MSHRCRYGMRNATRLGTYSDYWKKKITDPVKCAENCKCGTDKFVATFDWTTYPFTLTYQKIKNNQTINQSKLPKS